MKKLKVLVSVLIIFLSLGYATLIYAQEPVPIISVKINDQLVQFNQDILIVDYTTYLPLRDVSTILNASIGYDNTTKIVTLIYDEKIYNINDYKIKDNRAFISIRQILEYFNINFNYNSDTLTIEIFANSEVELTNYSSNRSYTDEELILLSKLVHLEALDLPFEGKLAIANVVDNRIESDIFPSNVPDVIFQIDTHVQFPPAHYESFDNTTPSKQAILASKMALEGINNIAQCLFFNNQPFQGLEDRLYRIISGEYFYN